MNKKKIVSLISAIAMTTTIFSSFVVAQAASTPVFSYDDGSTDGWVANTSTVTTVTDEETSDSYVKIAASGSSTYRSVFALPEEAQLEDNYVIEFDTLMHVGNGMGRLAKVTQVAFTGDAPGADTRDFGNADFLAAVNEKLGELTNADGAQGNWNTGSEMGSGYIDDIAVSVSSRVDMLGNASVNEDGTVQDTNVSDFKLNNGVTDGVKDNKDVWVRVQAVVSGGIASVSVIDSANNKLLTEKEFAASATKLTSIHATPGRGDNNFAPYDTLAGYICLDNVKIYDVSDGVVPKLTTAGLRGIPEVIETPAPEYPIVVSLPENATKFAQTKFASLKPVTILSIGTEAVDPVDLGDGIMASIGSRSTGADSSTYAQIEKLEIKSHMYNVLNAVNGRFSVGGRATLLTLPEFELASLAEDEIVVIEMGAQLKEGVGPAKVLFLKDSTVFNSSGNIYTTVATSISTTAEENPGSTDIVNPGTNAVVESGKWIDLAYVLKGDGTFSAYVDGELVIEETQKIHPGDSNTDVFEKLPQITFTNGSSSSTPTASTVTLTDVVVYTANEYVYTEPVPPAEPLTGLDIINATQDGDTVAVDLKNNSSKPVSVGVCVVAAYDENGTLIGVNYIDIGDLLGGENILPNEDVPLNITVEGSSTANKVTVFSWNSLGELKPFCSAFIVE